jgi:hypothetical protein
MDARDRERYVRLRARVALRGRNANAILDDDAVENEMQKIKKGTGISVMNEQLIAPICSGQEVCAPFLSVNS